MSSLIAVSRPPALPLPLPALPITVRSATLDDVPFIDQLQKLHSKQVGWMPTAQFEGKIKAGDVLVAVGATPASPASVAPGNPGDAGVARTEDAGEAGLAPTGYIVACDRYFKRDDVGIIYQMNVVPGKQRSLIGATLLKAQFDRSAYGCRLYCCWCAQDIAANRFWEAMGFVPLAFRSGSAAKARTHIFWQRRIRSGDETTPYWYPSQTSAGAIREDRLVFPIPPGTHWSDAKPIILPSGENPKSEARKPKQLPNPKSKVQNEKPAKPAEPQAIAAGGLRFGAAPEAAKAASAVKVKRGACPVFDPEAQTRREGGRRAQKNDPRLVSAARELRDRYLEEYNSGRFALASEARYEVSSTPALRSTALRSTALTAARRSTLNTFARAASTLDRVTEDR